MPEEKTATAIDFPVMEGKYCTITLPEGYKASTFVKEIVRVIYNQGYMFITILTKNSIYSNIPVRVQPNESFIDGQYVEKGMNVVTNAQSYITVSAITEVTNSGIKIIDSNGQEYIGDIKPV